jgi:hypothetical protein
MKAVLIKKFQGIDMKIYGTCDEIVLETKDIARLVDRQDIRDSFNIKEITFITEQDVKSILISSQKIATYESFQEWIIEVRNNIRLLDLEKKLKEQYKLLESQQQELNQYKEKTYEEIQKNGHLYVVKTDGGTKVGKTNDFVKKRIKGGQTYNVNDIQILLDYPTGNADLLEKVVHYILDRYRCNSNREFFECNVEYIKNVVRTAGKTIDTLKSTYQTIQPEELEEKLSMFKVNINNTVQEKFLPPIYDEFVLNNICKGGVGIRWSDLFLRFHLWCEENGLQVSKKQAKKYFEDCVFKCKEAPQKHLGRGWGGWSFKKPV